MKFMNSDEANRNSLNFHFYLKNLRLSDLTVKSDVQTFTSADLLLLMGTVSNGENRGFGWYAPKESF